MKSEGFSEIQTLSQDLILEGFDVQQLMYQLLEYYLKSTLPDLKKAMISEVIAEADIKVI